MKREKKNERFAMFLIVDEDCDHAFMHLLHDSGCDKHEVWRQLVGFVCDKALEECPNLFHEVLNDVLKEYDYES